MELGPGRPGDAVRRPGVDEVRLLGEVVTRLDVVVLRGDDVVPPLALGGALAAAVRGGEQGRDLLGDRGSAGDGKRAALAEVVLHVNDQQCSCHGYPRNLGLVVCGRWPQAGGGLMWTVRAGSPAESLSPSHGIEMRQARACSRDCSRVGRSSTG